MAAMVTSRTIFRVFLGTVAFFWIIYFIIYRHNFELTFRVQFVLNVNDQPETSLEDLFNSCKGRPYSGVDNYIKYATVKQNKSILQPYRLHQVPILNNVSAYRYPITVPACTNEQKAFVAIVSAPKNFEKRQIIRDTWIRHIDFPANIAFVIGMTSDPAIQKKIEQENSNHSDIIQVEMIDSYWNLTPKAVALLNWLNINCPKIPFVFKCDDDVYVNAHNLDAVLKALPQNEENIYGTKSPFHLSVQRNRGKWKVSFEEWPWTSYPQYLFGPSVLISGKALSPLLVAAQETPYFRIDDIYLTGLIVRKAGVRVRTTERMLVMGIKDLKTFSNPCFVIRTVSWLTKSSAGMKDSHQAAQKLYKDNTTACKEEAWSKTVLLDFSAMIMDDILVELISKN